METIKKIKNTGIFVTIIFFLMVCSFGTMAHAAEASDMAADESYRIKGRYLYEGNEKVDSAGWYYVNGNGWVKVTGQKKRISLVINGSGIYSWNSKSKSYTKKYKCKHWISVTSSGKKKYYYDGRNFYKKYDDKDGTVKFYVKASGGWRPIDTAGCVLKLPQRARHVYKNGRQTAPVNTWVKGINIREEYDGYQYYMDASSCTDIRKKGTKYQIVKSGGWKTVTGTGWQNSKRHAYKFSGTGKLLVLSDKNSRHSNAVCFSHEYSEKVSYTYNDYGDCVKCITKTCVNCGKQTEKDAGYYDHEYEVEKVSYSHDKEKKSVCHKVEKVKCKKCGYTKERNTSISAWDYLESACKDKYIYIDDDICRYVNKDVCTLCNEIVDWSDDHGHFWDDGELLSSTSVDDAYCNKKVKYTCSHCHGTKTATEKAKHEWLDLTEWYIPVTSIHYECGRCGFDYGPCSCPDCYPYRIGGVDQDIPSDYGWKLVKEDGNYYDYCTKCNKKIAIDATYGHCPKCIYGGGGDTIKVDKYLTVICADYPGEYSVTIAINKKYGLNIDPNRGLAIADPDLKLTHDVGRECRNCQHQIYD